MMKIFVFYSLLLAQVASADQVQFERNAALSPVLVTVGNAEEVIIPSACSHLREGDLSKTVFQPAEGLSEINPSQSGFDLSQAWGNAEQKFKKAVEECSILPCDVKLAASEVAQMAAVAQEQRMAVWAKLVQARVTNYLKTQLRSAYEFPGGISDPWDGEKWNDAHSQYFVTTLTFLGPSYRNVRQVLNREWKTEVLVDGTWVGRLRMRDLYSAHYFDSWGEAYELRCLPGGKLKVRGGLAVEVDQLKATDFLSKLGRNKLKSAFFERSEKYLSENMRTLMKLLKEATQPKVGDSSTDPNPGPSSPKGK